MAARPPSRNPSMIGFSTPRPLSHLIWIPRNVQPHGDDRPDDHRPSGGVSDLGGALKAAPAGYPLPVPGDQPEGGIQAMGRQISRPEGTATFSLFIVIPATSPIVSRRALKSNLRYFSGSSRSSASPICI